MRSLVEFAASLYRYVVLDVPRSDAAALDALDQASRIVVVANQELATVRNASRIAAALRQRYGNERVTVIVNRVDSHAEIGREDVEKVVGTRVVHSVPSDYRMALRALNKGAPARPRQPQQARGQLPRARARPRRRRAGADRPRRNRAGCSAC